MLLLYYILFIYIIHRLVCPPGRTLALGDVGGAVEVRGGVPRAGYAVVLPELGLVRPGRAADAAVGGGVVVVTWSAVHWRRGAGVREG